jgi:hypothetical protein
LTGIGRPGRVNVAAAIRPVLVLAVAAACLAACSSSSFEPLKMPALLVQLQLDSVPQGADARISLGPGCRTPCTVPLTDPPSSFSVSYTLNEFLPVTVPVRITPVPGGFWSWDGATVDPNPVVATLQPVPPPPPPPKPVRKMRPKPKPPKAAAAPPAAGSPFPMPAAAPPLPPTR